MKKTPTSNRLSYKSFYRRNLPHIQPMDTDLFVTFRLAGSLPHEALVQMAEERRWRDGLFNDKDRSKGLSTQLARRHFAILEKYLDRPTAGPTWLADPEVANLVSEALHYRDGEVYRLDAFSIMPNHVHSVLRPSAQDNLPRSLSSIMHSLKRNTAKQANRVLGRPESFGRMKVSIITYAMKPKESGLLSTYLRIR